ncbi:vanadium-dependent haloperoxidase [uncultured Erythrobacter sp.]|uniref:vanadium-dependent haloperoxidase n=1 Tax=uncultured Erythrobacter sp. TaxID=263913 RepID=UPI00262A0AEB|nr:vanadium-dependent haloperoxidase [uncultured Erythrobacter sp.]
MKLTRRNFVTGSLIGAGAIGLGGCSTANFGTRSSYLTGIVEPQNHNTVFHWVDIAMQQVRDQRIPPPRAAYNFAAPMVAGFVAANAIIGRYADPYNIGPAPAGADPELAYGVAFATAASECFKQPFLWERSAFKGRFADGESKRLGIEWGRKVGIAINQMRTGDGAEPHVVNFYHGRYKRRDDELKWTPTGPAYAARPGPAVGAYDRGLFPGHGQIKPWTMVRPEQFRAETFPDPRSPEFAEQFELVRSLGGKDSQTRTPDQSEIALFWEDGPWGITPPGHFLLIAAQVMQDRGFDFLDLARNFALLGATQADASISAWDSKYHYDILRPETAICLRAGEFRSADMRVRQQRSWESYIPTPNFPAYTSGHSTFGAAGIEMTKLLIGTDAVNFSHESPDQVLWPTLTGKRRYFTSLDQAAYENGWSRLYGGVHWLADHEAADKAGRQIARHAFDTMFARRG